MSLFPSAPSPEHWVELGRPSPAQSSLAGARRAAASVLFQPEQELQNPWKTEILDSHKQTSPFLSCLKARAGAWGWCCHCSLPTASASRTLEQPRCAGHSLPVLGTGSSGTEWHRVSPRLSELVSKAVRESEKSKCKISRFCGTAGTDCPYVPHTHHQSAGKCSQLPASHFAIFPGWICQGDVAASPRPQERLGSVCPRWTFLLAGL